MSDSDIIDSTFDLTPILYSSEDLAVVRVRFMVSGDDGKKPEVDCANLNQEGHAWSKGHAWSDNIVWKEGHAWSETVDWQEASVALVNWVEEE